MIIKVLLVAAALVFGLMLLRERFPGQRLALRRLLGLGVVLAGVVAVLLPNTVTWIANRIGVGRGTDLVLYVLVMVFLYTTLAMHQRINHLESRLATLARAVALGQTGTTTRSDTGSRDAAA